MYSKQCRRFSQDFKKKAVQASFESPESVGTVAAKLELHPDLLSRWRRQMAGRENDKEPDFSKLTPPARSNASLEREVRRLKKSLERQKLENEILKKATEYFAKNRK